MYTRLTRKEVKEGKFDYNDYYQELSLAGDILRVIYINLGWVHMTEEFFKPRTTIEELLDGCMEDMKRGRNSSSHATAGVKVATSYESFNDSLDEDVLVIDVSFEIV